MLVDDYDDNKNREDNDAINDDNYVNAMVVDDHYDSEEDADDNENDHVNDYDDSDDANNAHNVNNDDVDDHRKDNIEK